MPIVKVRTSDGILLDVEMTVGDLREFLKTPPVAWQDTPQPTLQQAIKAVPVAKGSPIVTYAAVVPKIERHDIISEPAFVRVNENGRKIPVPPKGMFFCAYCPETFEAPAPRGIHEAAHRRHPKKMRKVMRSRDRVKKTAPITVTTYNNGSLESVLSMIQSHTNMSDADRKALGEILTQYQYVDALSLEEVKQKADALLVRLRQDNSTVAH